MNRNQLTSITEAAENLHVSEALVRKFISQGLITPVYDEKKPGLTPYNYRRLIQAVDLYEQCIPGDRIAVMLDN